MFSEAVDLMFSEAVDLMDPRVDLMFSEAPWSKGKLKHFKK
jgi:hypothetical protein